MIKKYNVFARLAKHDNVHANRIKDTGIAKLKQRTLILESVDILLAIAAIPMGYLFLVGWKYD